MAAFSKICLLSLAGQAVMALPRPGPLPSSDQLDQLMDKADNENTFYPGANFDDLERSFEETAIDTSDEESKTSDLPSKNPALVKAAPNFIGNLKEIVGGVVTETDAKAAAEAKALSEGAGTGEAIIISKLPYGTDDFGLATIANSIRNSLGKVFNRDASSKNSDANSKRDFTEEHPLQFAPKDLGDEEFAAFTAGYTSTQSTSYTVEPTAVVAEAAKVEEAVVIPTKPASNEPLSSETAPVEEQVKYGAAPVKEQEKKGKKVTESSTKEEEQEEKGEDEVSSSKEEKKDNKKEYGAIEKRGQYDQQWADYYNKAGAYEGLEYDVHDYLKEHEQTLPEDVRPSRKPAQEPQPQPQPQPQPPVEENPIFIPAPEEPVVEPKPAPQPQEDAPVIIPAHQSPPQEPPQEGVPEPVQAGQPGEEQLQDFVMFVPKDQSGGAKPYMVPANEYNPDSPPQRLPPGVKPPPFNLGGQPSPQGSEPGKGQEAINVPLPDAPAGAEYEYVPVGPAGGPLSDGSYPLPEWFPGRPGPTRVEKRGEIEERSCAGHPYGRELECSPSHGCNGCIDEPFRPSLQNVESSLSALAKRELKNKVSKPFKSEAPKIPKPAAPKFNFDNEKNTFNPYVPPPPPYQAPPPPPPSPKPFSPKGLPKPKPIKFDIDFDDHDDEVVDDDYQGSPPPPDQDPIKPRPQSALADFLGDGRDEDLSYNEILAELLSCEMFRNHCFDHDHPEEEYPECHQPFNPCQDFPFFAPFPEARTETKPRPWKPSVDLYDEYEYQQPEQDPVIPNGGYPQVELQPEYPEFQHEDSGYYTPDCHTCGPCDGSYSEHLEPSHACPQNTCPYPCEAYEPQSPPPPPPQSGPRYEAQQPCYDCEFPEPVPYYAQPEQDCYTCEKPDHSPPLNEPVPEPAEACYDCQYHPETYEPANESQAPGQPCNTCSQGFEPISHVPEPAPESQPPYTCDECEQPEYYSPPYGEPQSAPEPVPEPQPQGPEQRCYACEKTPEPQPEQYESASQPYEPEPEPQSQEPCYGCAQPEVHEQPAPQPYEPEPQPQPQEPCYDCAQPEVHEQPAEPQPSQPQPEEPCHACEQGSECQDQPEAPCSGPNFEHPSPDRHPHDGSYPIEEPAGPEPAQRSEGSPTGEAYVHPDGAYSYEHPERYPEDESLESASEPSYPWHFPAAAFERQEAPFVGEQHPEESSPEHQPEPECHECQHGPDPETPTAEQPEAPQYEPAPEPECHECQQGPRQSAAQFPEQYVAEKNRPTPRPEGFESQQSPDKHAPEVNQPAPEPECHECQQAPEYYAQP